MSLEEELRSGDVIHGDREGVEADKSRGKEEEDEERPLEVEESEGVEFEEVRGLVQMRLQEELQRGP
jgi:hypothetical protein